MEASVSNDRCADNDVREFYAYLLRCMEEDDRREAKSGWDWKEIHGEDYEEWQEPLAPVHTNDEYYNDHFDNDKWYNDESDSDSENYKTSRVNTKSLQPAATGHHYKGTTVRRSGAEPAPQGKGSGTKWVRHFQEIHNNFVQCLLSGNFGWPPLRRRSPLGLTDELEWENQAGCNPYGSASVKVDCRETSESAPIASKHEPSQKDQRMASNKTVDCRFGTKPKRRSLQQVRSMLSQAAEGTEVPTSCAWQKWKRAHSKPSTAATDNAETPTGDSAPDIVRFSTTTTTTIDHETGGDPQPYKGQKQSGVDGPSKQGRSSSDKTVTKRNETFATTYTTVTMGGQFNANTKSTPKNDTKMQREVSVSASVSNDTSREPQTTPDQVMSTNEFPTHATVSPFTPTMHEIKKRNKHYKTHTQSRGADAITFGTAESMVLPTKLATTETGLIVRVDTTEVFRKKGSPLCCPTQKRKAMKVAQLEAIQSQPSLIMRKKGRNNKKKQSPQAKQWRRCGCGRLYRMTTGLCACAEAKSLLKNSKPQETKREDYETIWSDDQSEKNKKHTLRTEPTLKTADSYVPQSSKKRLSPKTTAIHKEWPAVESTVPTHICQSIDMQSVADVTSLPSAMCTTSPVTTMPPEVTTMPTPTTARWSLPTVARGPSRYLQGITTKVRTVATKIKRGVATQTMKPQVEWYQTTPTFATIGKERVTTKMRTSARQIGGLLLTNLRETDAKVMSTIIDDTTSESKSDSLMRLSTTLSINKALNKQGSNNKEQQCSQGHCSNQTRRPASKRETANITQNKQGLHFKCKRKRTTIRKDKKPKGNAQRRKTLKGPLDVSGRTGLNMMDTAVTIEMEKRLEKIMRTMSLCGRLLVTHMIPWYGSSYTRGILPYGISRYKAPGFVTSVSRVGVCLGVHTARPPG